MARDTSQPRKGVSLAKGPVGIIGILGILYGLSALILKSHGFALHIPHGAVHGKKWIGLEVNGWSDLLFIAAGLALLLAAPLHWGAKSMSFLVGGVMIAAGVIAYVRKDGVFGIFAANHLTELVWAAAGVLLLILALLPRVGAREGREDPDEVGATASRPTTRRGSEAGVERGSATTADRDSRPRSRGLVGRRQAERTPESSGQEVRWQQDADAQDRPRGADEQITDDKPVS